jgi:GNAT superfamily N-acetyltransferase
LSNAVVLLRPPTDVGALLAEVAELIPPGSPYYLLSRWQEPDLTPHGLVLLGYPPLMVRFPSPHEVPARRGVEVLEVADPHELAIAERLLVEGYPMPDLEPLSPGDLLGPAILSPATKVWLARVDGAPAAVAAAHLHAGVTLVEYVATLPAARGRGAGSAVTWAATLADPTRPAMLVASDDGRPVYEAMGYVAIERWAAWLRPGTRVR